MKRLSSRLTPILSAAAALFAGQYQSYLFHALQQYQAKHQTPLYGRNNPIMSGIVAQYNKQDLEDIAAYIASLKGDLYVRDEMH